MEIIKLQSPDSTYTEFMEMPNGTLKNIRYYRDIMSRNYAESSICKKDGCMYYAYNVFTVKKSKNGYYVNRKHRQGFTVNEKGKLSVWFGANIFQIPFISDVFNYLRCNWLNQKLYPYVTKTILEKIIAGKITNNYDVVRAYFKMMKINASPSLFIELINKTDINKSYFLRQMCVAKDINHLMEYIIKRKTDVSREFAINSYIIDDMIQEAMILDEKIDFKWSVNKLNEVHKKWTQEIMRHEIDALDDVAVESLDKFDKYTPKGFKLLKTQKEVFYEGRTMNHCVYTGYWTTIKNGRYLAYHIEINGEQATLGINVDQKLSFNQCFSFYNRPISTELNTIVQEFYNNLVEQVERDGILKTEKTVVEDLETPLFDQIPF